MKASTLFLLLLGMLGIALMCAVPMVGQYVYVHGPAWVRDGNGTPLFLSCLFTTMALFTGSMVCFFGVTHSDED